MGCTKPRKLLSGVEFMTVMTGLIPADRLEAICAKHAPVARTTPKMTASQVVTGLVYHQLQPAGPLGRHAWQLHGVEMSESAHAQRRAGLPGELFDAIMAEALRPLAEAQRQPEGFFWVITYLFQWAHNSFTTSCRL